MAYHSGIIEEKDEEFTQLLKKIADMEIEDFPSNIPTKIATWINHQNNDDESSDGNNH
ncbi:hypothetical protein Godav_018146 [Gossypium davidsonii]|uniref:Uncharacterized protein n=1 Tax=Gossypium davidsonii TaxID=34287 RepID=A0A7J8QWU5_GOSDV|nr:hypothetical protein [Gossypium davidsonii]